MTSENRTWQTNEQLAEHAKLLIARVGRRRNVNEVTVSSTLGTSIRRLQRALNSAGTSVRTERLKARMAWAEYLLGAAERPLALGKGTYTLAEIASSCGYAHASAFTRAFKSEHGGITPQAWRKRHAALREADQSNGAQRNKTGPFATATRRERELAVILERRFNKTSSPTAGGYDFWPASRKSRRDL